MGLKKVLLNCLMAHNVADWGYSEKVLNPHLGSFCMELEWSPCAYVDSLRLLWFPSHSPKNGCYVNCLLQIALTSVCVLCVDGCLPFVSVGCDGLAVLSRVYPTCHLMATGDKHRQPCKKKYSRYKWWMFFVCPVWLSVALWWTSDPSMPNPAMMKKA